MCASVDLSVGMYIGVCMGTVGVDWIWVRTYRICACNVSHVYYRQSPYPR